MLSLQEEDILNEIVIPVLWFSSPVLELQLINIFFFLFVLTSSDGLYNLPLLYNCSWLHIADDLFLYCLVGNKVRVTAFFFVHSGFDCLLSLNYFSAEE